MTRLCLWLRLLALAVLCAVAAAATTTTTTTTTHVHSFRVLEAAIDEWAAPSSRQLALYFKRPPFSLDTHVATLRHRRLLHATPARHLTASECMANLDELKAKYEGTFKNGLNALKSDVNLEKLDVRRLLPELKEFGAKIRSFDFASLGKNTLAGLFGGVELLDAFSLAADVGNMVQKAREVVGAIQNVTIVVRSMGSNVLELLERSEFDHFINAALASADAVFAANTDTMDKLVMVCRAFDYSKITQMANVMQSYQLCTRETDENKAKKCRVAVGISAVGAIVQLISAASFCDAHVAISQSHSAHPLAALKTDAEKLIQSIMAAMPDGAKGDPEWEKDYALVDEYATNITAHAQAAVTGDAPDSADAFVKEVLADLYSRTLSSVAAVKNYTSSDLYKNMTALNPDAGAAGTIVGLALGKAQKTVMDKLTGVQDKVVAQHEERMGLYDTINNTLWTNHAEFMGKVDQMSTLFTDQHNERFGRLKGVEDRLGNIQSATSNGFSQLRGRIVDMGRKFVSQVQGIESNVVSTGAETTNYLSNAVMEANQQIEARISGVGDTVVRNHEKIMSAIGDAQETAATEFGATQNLLYSASDRFRQTIDGGLDQVAQTASNTFNQINDAVYKRMEEGHSILDGIMSGMSSDFAMIDNALVILENQAANMSKSMAIAKEFLVDIHVQLDGIQQMLDDLPTVVQQELFQSDVDGLHRKYQNMRKVYRDYLESDLPVKTIAESCKSFQIYDLFLRFLRLLDISDAELPRQLDNFQYSRSAYEQFGVTVVTVLNDLSFFDGVCAKAQFSATMKDLEDKAKEQSDLILKVSSKLAHQVEDVIPALVLMHRVQSRIEDVSEQAWDVQGAQTAEKLRVEFQEGLGEFAYVTVIHAGKDGALQIDHLDRNRESVDGKPRHSGAIVSKNQKLAVLWSQTRRLPDAAIAAANQTELLRQGIYRGNVTSTSSSCFIATSSDDYYPSCHGCSCVHYEDFASLTDPMAGRAVTYLADKSYDASFAVESVFSAGVDYMLGFVMLNIGLLSPGSVATAQLQAPVISESTQKTTMMSLWEGTSGTGRFDVLPSDIKGTLLATNELTLSITHGVKVLRHTFALFCDGYAKTTRIVESDLQLQYSCSQVPRDTAPSELVQLGYTYVTSGLPTNRLDRAVCAQSATRKTCQVVGAVDAVGARDSDSGPEQPRTLTFGAQVPSVTLFTDQGFRGPFVVCRDCTTATLDELVATYHFQTAYIGVPDAPAQMLSIQCAEIAHSSPDLLLLCRPTAV